MDDTILEEELKLDVPAPCMDKIRLLNIMDYKDIGPKNTQRMIGLSYTLGHAEWLLGAGKHQKSEKGI